MYAPPSFLSVLLQSTLRCTMCTWDSRNWFWPNKMGLILKSQISNSIEHIIPTCSVKSKYSPVVSTRFRVKLFPIIGYRRILLSHVHIVHCKNIQYLNKVWKISLKKVGLIGFQTRRCWQEACRPRPSTFSEWSQFWQQLARSRGSPR